MGKLTISMPMFNSYVKLPEGKWCQCARSFCEYSSLHIMSIYYVYLVDSGCWLSVSQRFSKSRGCIDALILLFASVSILVQDFHQKHRPWTSAFHLRLVFQHHICHMYMSWGWQIIISWSKPRHCWCFHSVPDQEPHRWIPDVCWLYQHKLWVTPQLH